MARSILALWLTQPDHQHHDAGRAGAGRRHSRRRSDRLRSKTSTRIWRAAAPSARAALDATTETTLPATARDALRSGRFQSRRFFMSGRGAGHCSCRSRWRSASRWSRPICSPARWCRSFRSGFCGASRSGREANRRPRRFRTVSTALRGAVARADVRFAWLVLAVYLAGQRR